MSFGERLKQLRTERDLSKYALEKTSGVPHANITLFESGARGVPTHRTVFDLAMGLGLDREESRRFLEHALGERFLVELEKFAIYYYLALVGDKEVERVTRDVREQMNNESHIVDALIGAGHEVAIIDSFWEHGGGRRAHVNAQARLYEVDIRDAGAVADVFSSFQPQVVSHHAAQHSVDRRELHPRKRPAEGANVRECSQMFAMF